MKIAKTLERNAQCGVCEEFFTPVGLKRHETKCGDKMEKRNKEEIDKFISKYEYLDAYNPSTQNIHLQPYTNYKELLQQLGDQLFNTIKYVRKDDSNYHDEFKLSFKDYIELLRNNKMNLRCSPYVRDVRMFMDDDENGFITIYDQIGSRRWGKYSLWRAEYGSVNFDYA